MSTPRSTLYYATLIATASMAIGMVIASRFDMAPSSSAQTFTIPSMNSAPLDGPIDAGTFRMIAKQQTATVVNIRTEARKSTQLNDFFGGGGRRLAASFLWTATRRRRCSAQRAHGAVGRHRLRHRRQWVDPDQ